MRLSRESFFRLLRVSARPKSAHQQGSSPTRFCQHMLACLLLRVALLVQVDCQPTSQSPSLAALRVHLPAWVISCAELRWELAF